VRPPPKGNNAHLHFLHLLLAILFMQHLMRNIIHKQRLIERHKETKGWESIYFVENGNAKHSVPGILGFHRKCKKTKFTSLCVLYIHIICILLLVLRKVDANTSVGRVVNMFILRGQKKRSQTPWFLFQKVLSRVFVHNNIYCCTKTSLYAITMILLCVHDKKCVVFAG